MSLPTVSESARDSSPALFPLSERIPQTCYGTTVNTFIYDEKLQLSILQTLHNKDPIDTGLKFKHGIYLNI